MSTLDAIVADLRTLPPPKLAKAAALIRELVEPGLRERRAILGETAGAWSGPDGAVIELAVEEGCERIDARDW